MPLWNPQVEMLGDQSWILWTKQIEILGIKRFIALISFKIFNPLFKMKSLKVAFDG